MDSVRKAIATQAGLSANELRAMGRIAETDGITPKELAADLELTTGAITAITNGLVARSLIKRLEQAHDRRSLLLQLTATGHSTMEGVYHQFQDALAEASRGLTTDAQSAVAGGLTEITTLLRSE